jgi:eukaryotic-like serine/threonine-protein kinase
MIKFIPLFLSAIVGFVAINATVAQVSNEKNNGGEMNIYLPLTAMGIPPASMETIFVPAGEFPMGCDPAHNGGAPCQADELPLHAVYLDAYYIDATPVTNGQYAECVAGGTCAAPASFASYSRSSYYNNPTYVNYPVIFVHWYDALNYCHWTGKRLPTEAEWEKAARGTTVQAFPWGDEPPTCSLANYGGWDGCVGDSSVVGHYLAGVSPYGAFDMAGNVWEWVNDWYSATYYSESPYVNPPGPDTGPWKTLRGGAWSDNSDSLRVANRGQRNPWFALDASGFRCAYTPAE